MNNMILGDKGYERELENVIILNIYEGLNKENKNDYN